MSKQIVTTQSVKTIRLKNILTQQRAILGKISTWAESGISDNTFNKQISEQLERTVAAIETICSRQETTPASLTGTSRSIYAWMKFLTDDTNLKLHLDATCRAYAIATKLKGTHQKVVVEFINMAALYKSKSDRHTIVIQISIGFINANDEILEAVITSAIMGKKQPLLLKVREYAQQEEYIYIMLEIDLIADILAERAKGNYYDLEELFNQINHDYFANTLLKPRLTWNSCLTFRKFGHYERVRDRIVLSQTLDQQHIPQFVVEFVLYHELLHKHHGMKWINGRQAVHTSEFRHSERQFKHYKEAQQWLRKLAVT